MNRSINTEVTILFLPRPRATQNPWPLSGRWQLAFQDNLITSATGSATEHSQEKPVSGCDSNAAHLGSSKRMERQSPRRRAAVDLALTNENARLVARVRRLVPKRRAGPLANSML